MIKVVIKYGIHIFVNHSRRSRIRGVYRNKMHVAKLECGAFSKIWIHPTSPRSQPSRVEGYAIQGTHLTVIYICLELYIICYHAVKVHSEGLYCMISYEQIEFISIWHILSVGQNIWKSRGIPLGVFYFLQGKPWVSFKICHCHL